MAWNTYKWDKLLKIRTSGRDDSRADRYHYPYEPTPYTVLERLAGSGYVGKRDVLLDYGCGKGRVGFYLAWQVRCRIIGIDFDERMFKAAMNNRSRAVSGPRTSFVYGPAETYRLPEEVSCCYFFNPFSTEILEKVLSRIRVSCYDCPREIRLFLYYPTDQYLACLMTQDMVLFQDEIDCRDLFEGGDSRERILVFSMGGC